MDDTIRRQDAIATAESMYDACDTGDITDYRDLMVEALKVLPKARKITTCKGNKKNTNKEKIAFWVKDEWESGKHIEPVFRCSSCGGMAWGASELTNYCPNCGARMGNGAGER